MSPFGLHKLTLGVAPIGKPVFSQEAAISAKEELLSLLRSWQIDFTDLEGVVPDGLVRCTADAERAAAHLRAAGVGALFLPHCSFGTEDAAALCAKELGVPTLLWGPRDDAPLPDGSRARDSLCGLFPTSKVLQKLGVRFTYIENCRPEEPPLRQGLFDFLRAAHTVQAVRTMRVASVGGRMGSFWCTLTDESALLTRFGIRVIPVELTDFMADIEEKARSRRGEYAAEFSSRWRGLFDMSGLADDGFLDGLAYRDALWELAERERLDAVSLNHACSFARGRRPGFNLGMFLANDRLFTAAEGDLLGAVSGVMLQNASSSGSCAFLPEPVMRHPEDDNAVCLWHGNGAPSLVHPDVKQIGLRPAWILKNDRNPPTNFKYRLKDGHLTLCRLEADEKGGYMLGCGAGDMTDGPETNEMYGWLHVDNWAHWERRLVEGPYLHHLAAIYGSDCTAALREACRYLDIPSEVF